MLEATDRSERSGHDDLRERIRLLAADLHGDGHVPLDPAELLTQVTWAAVELLPEIDHAGITLVARAGKKSRPHELTSTAPTGPVPAEVDALQHAYDEGPCFEAIWRERTVRIDDLSTETRWPAFVAAALEATPVRSSMSMQLFVGEMELGALNLYSDRPGSISRATEYLAEDLATHAAIALLGARRQQQFRSALASRDIIGQAKGVLMERFAIDAVAAFDLLRRLSQESNTRLADIAERLLASGVGTSAVTARPTRNLTEE